MPLRVAEIVLAFGFSATSWRPSEVPVWMNKNDVCTGGKRRRETPHQSSNDRVLFFAAPPQKMSQTVCFTGQMLLAEARSFFRMAQPIDVHMDIHTTCFCYMDTLHDYRQTIRTTTRIRQ